jgi:hypothetical protein
MFFLDDDIRDIGYLDLQSTVSILASPDQCIAISGGVTRPGVIDATGHWLRLDSAPAGGRAGYFRLVQTA